MRLQLLIVALTLVLPSVAWSAATSGLDTIAGADSDDDRLAARGKKAKKGKKGKKNKDPEPETPPPPPPDGDGDGIPDADDKCPAEAEDKDLHEDKDGCPDPDNDADGILDADDDCPFEAENLDGIADSDGCPEPPPKISPLDATIELLDGTKITGKVVRIVAVDEDEEDSKPEEPETFEVIVDDENEYATSWANIRSLKSEKVKFTEAVDCYSEGVQELGEAPTWECTLKHPTVVGLDSPERRGTHRFIDRKMKRLDFQFESLECSGNSCEDVTAENTLSLYLYKLIAFEKNEDEPAAVTTLQKRLRALQSKQVKKATFAPASSE